MDENLRVLVRGTLLGLLEAESPLIEGDSLRKKINGRALTKVVNGGRGEDPKLDMYTVVHVCRSLGLQIEHHGRGRTVVLNEESLRSSVVGPRLIELYPRESLRVEVRRDAVEDQWYLLVTGSDQREVRVDEINLGSVIYRAKR